MNKRTFQLLLILGISALLINGCDKEREHPVPYVRVMFDFNIIHHNLGSPGLSAQFSRELAGYQGIIAYRLSMDAFRAYDRACPVNPHQHIVSIDPDNSVLASCPDCGSVFILTDGSVVEGPSQYPLREYRAIFDPSSNRLRITN